MLHDHSSIVGVLVRLRIEEAGLKKMEALLLGALMESNRISEGPRVYPWVSLMESLT